jgi:4-hydroxybenzoate polyprenyltransferase
MNFKKLKELILIKQTLFVLPFAYLGVLFAGSSDIFKWIWVTLALVAARTAGMSFNRLIDRDIDKKIPHTRNSLLPKGDISGGEVLMPGILSTAVFVFSSYMLNNLCYYLSFLTILILFVYSYSKRFSSASYFYLGFIEAAAPVGGYLAISGEFSIIPFILGFAMMSWISGLEIVYSLQDMEFDKKENLFSIPVKYGVEKSVKISAISYFFSAVALITAGLLAGRGIPFWVGIFCVIIIFFRQQSLVRNEDMATSIFEFFQINQYISFVLFAGTFIDVFLK